MKTITLIGLILSASLFGAPRVIEMKTETIDGAVHWMPKVVEVQQGETVIFRLKHELVGGFDFHGFFIPALKISEQVNRTKAGDKNAKPKDIEKKIPTDLKSGEYEIGCQFHPKHVSAKLVVTPAK